MFSIRKRLYAYTKDVADLLHKTGDVHNLKKGHHVRGFFSHLREVFFLIRQEPEILAFAGLQWVCIILAYMGWVQALDWIPEHVWQEAERNRKDNYNPAFDDINLFMIGWSFAIVFCVSLPLSVLSAAMVAVHALRHEGYPSTFSHALWLALRNAGQQWVFAALDAWVTLYTIFDRIPGEGRRSRRTYADELMYYTWKMATIGMAPALLYGRGLTGAAQDSLKMIRDAPVRAMAIRLGYSGVCWIIGIATYALTIVFLRMGGASFLGDVGGRPSGIYSIYFYLTVPALVAVTVIAVLVRPFFMLMVAGLYGDVIQPAGLLGDERAAARGGGFSWSTPVFLLGMMLALVVMFVVLMPGQTGLPGWVGDLADRAFLPLSPDALTPQ